MPSYKLVYFNGRARAETARLAFVASGIEFEDVRVEAEKWPELKPKTFSGYLPYLEVDGKVLVESMAIARFVAREGKLAGGCNYEQAQIDSIVDILSYVVEKVYKVVYYAKGEEKERLHKELVEKTAPETFKLLEKFLQDQDFFVHNKLSLADLHFYTVLESMTPAYEDWPKLSPKLKALFDRVATEPKIAEYLKKRPVTEY
ncbi:hypothetical protein HELRODRAFT_184885 [Helobdella robusta]|uniref:glutathione transferase n=1 Tax=Helobdella robusta TaxID=6412 RepID=T1FM48_HELRO|nr:hypothetical protein HELRODRAFT_184885 [Helobdella robusta]ESO13220.1 hypothetical protein HELRODRAFT_184885 [Helobdella robusta]